MRKSFGRLRGIAKIIYIDFFTTFTRKEWCKMTDIEIARKAKLETIDKIAEKLDISE